MDTNKKIYFDWSEGVLIISIVVMILLLLVLYFTLRNFTLKLPASSLMGKIVITLIIGFASIYFLLNTPIYLKYDPNGLKIKMIVGSRYFSREQIVEVKAIPVDSIAGSKRSFGSSGIGGYTGVFRNNTLGIYNMYVTNKANLILLSTIEKKKYVFNCPQRDALVEFAKNNYNL